MLDPIGASVDPLGEVLIKLLPDGLNALLAPAAMLPALLPSPLLVAAPVVDPLRPVVLPLDPVTPIVPLWACAAAPASASAVISASEVSLMIQVLG